MAVGLIDLLIDIEWVYQLLLLIGWLTFTRCLDYRLNYKAYKMYHDISDVNVFFNSQYETYIKCF